MTVARAGEEGVKELLVLPVNHTWMMGDKRVISAAARFLKTGRFEAMGGMRERGEP